MLHHHAIAELAAAVRAGDPAYLEPLHAMIDAALEGELDLPAQFALVLIVLEGAEGCEVNCQERALFGAVAANGLAFFGPKPAAG